jgi:5-methylcytosine-specific restriction endonuclease McrA
MTDESHVGVVLQLQRLLEEGEFTATYKFALLKSLADLCLELTPAPDETLTLTVRAISERFIEYYWRQSLPYRHQAVLQQNPRRQAYVISCILAAQRAHKSLDALRRDEGQWTKLVADVADNIERYPLRLLQRLPGGIDAAFLYDPPAGRPAGRQAFRGSITLKPKVAGAFRAFHSLIVSMVESGWIRQLLAIKQNRPVVGDVEGLTEFLFGSERETLAGFGDVIRELYGPECFYCSRRLGAGEQLDHFIPWSRYPADLGHNFVLACGECNRRKADSLASMRFLERWWQRTVEDANALARALDSRNLPHDVSRSMGVVKWAYGRAQTSSPSLWDGGRSYTALPGDWLGRLKLDSRMSMAAEPSDRHP